MKTTQHTPLPWIDIDAQTARDLPHRLIADCGTAGIVTRETGKLVIREHGEANAKFIVTACNAHYELIDVLCSIINGSVRISDKANDMLSEHDPKVIRARAILGQLLLDAMKWDCDAAIQSAQGKE